MALSITHNAVVVIPDDPAYPVGSDEWNAAHSITGAASPSQGGTGVANNAASTITISGSFGTTFIVTGTTSITLPTSGTLLANSRQIISGGGLTGGGDLSSDRTLAVGAGTGITVNADDVAINQAFTPTWTGKHIFQAGALLNTGTFSDTFIGSGGSALFALNETIAAASATVPEIGAQFTISSNVGTANKATAHKIALTASAIGGANSADVYSLNTITQGFAGAGGYLVTGIESDINNVGANANTLGAATAAYGNVSVAAGTAESTAGYWATASSTGKWTYGFATSNTNASSIKTADFFSSSSATNFIQDTGAHSTGLNLTGTYSSNTAVMVPTGAAYGFSSGGGMISTTTYTQFFDPSGNNDVSFGGTGDPTNYFANTSHVFLSRNAGVTFMTANATGLGIGVAPAVELHVSTDGVSELRLDSYYAAGSNGSQVQMKGARGTTASPTAVQSGDRLLSFGAFGYGATAFSSAAKGIFNINATENWTDSAQGTKATFEVTETGTTTRTAVLEFDKPTTATQTAGKIWDVDNGALERITVGAADSGGAGFKVLRIPN